MSDLSQAVGLLRISRSLIWLVSGLAIGCVSPYQLAIRDASVIEPDEIVTLEPLEPLPGDRYRVVTWTRYPDSYKKGQTVTLTWNDVWVTIDGDVREACKLFDPRTLRTDLQQLLGLPPDDDRREFVTLFVSVDDLFRPCADPDESRSQCTAEFPDDVDRAHQTWYANQVASSYASSGGFPWTRLGYTYNWKPGAEEFGVAEYVIRKSARVEVVDRLPTAAYCGKSTGQP